MVKDNLENFPGPHWPHLRAETRLAVKAALAAGKRILQIYDKDFRTEFKEEREPFTAADTESEHIIYEMLSMGAAPVLSEEKHNKISEKHPEKLWIVDPLDGTKDFIGKTGEFSVMIAFTENQKPTIGVVYQPTEAKLYVAQKGRGAYLLSREKWRKLRVSNISDLENARAVMSRHHLSDMEKNKLEKMGIKKVLQMGSAGLKAGIIAEGEAELYFTFTDKIKLWDTAAAECLVREAGGEISDIRGEPLAYGTGRINHPFGLLVSSGKTHKRAVLELAN